MIHNKRARQLLSFFLLFLIAIFWMEFSIPGFSQEKIPETPAGKRLKETLDAINSGRYDVIKAYISSNFTKGLQKMNFVDSFMDLYDGSRGFDFYSTRDSTETKVVGIFKNRLTRMWLDIGVAVKKKPPYKIQGIILGPFGPPEGTSPLKKLSDSEISEEINAHLDRLAKADVISGTVLLAKDGNILFKGAYGLANKKFNVPNQIVTKFNIASMGKMFTAVSIAQLVERGKLSYDAFIGDYLGSDWVKKKIGKKVRIHHLLTHTSGLRDYLEKINEKNRLSIRSIDDYKPLIAKESLKFKPGSKRSYSNSGFFLLGVIIEKVTGQSYYDYVREHIFQSTGMTHTDYYEIDRELEKANSDFAIPYVKKYTEKGVIWRENISDQPIKGGPAGGGFSTVEDLLKFDIALRTNKLISEKSKNLLLTAKPELNSANYGYGFDIKEKYKERIVGHRGWHPGVSAVFHMYLDSGYTVIILFNYSGGMLSVNGKIQELLFAEYLTL